MIRGVTGELMLRTKRAVPSVEVGTSASNGHGRKSPADVLELDLTRVGSAAGLLATHVLSSDSGVLSASIGSPKP